MTRITGTRGNKLPLVVISLVLIAFVYVHLRAYLLYWPLEIGMTKAALIEHLGEPTRREPTLIFCHEYIPWSGECPAIPTKELLYFKVGMDRWIIVGVDESNIARFKTLGDT